MKLILVFLFIVPQTIFSQEEQKRIALIIGNGHYLYGNSLKNPVNDADLIASTLSKLGFKVIKHTDIKHQEVHDAILNFAKRLKYFDVALFYYAGHGIQIDGINYLIPVDAKPQFEEDLRLEAIQINDIIKEFEYHTNNTNIVILDACRNNPLRSWTRGAETGFKAIKPPSGTIIAFATSEGETASDGNKKNGLYTSELVKQMLISQRIEDVFINTRIAVEIASNGNQSPQEWSKLRGKFYFQMPKKEVVSQVNQSKNTTRRSSLHEGSRSFTNSRSDVIMVYVHGGIFQMGNNEGKADEKPSHKIELDNFSISKNEITNEQYCKFLNYIYCNRNGKHKRKQYINIRSSSCQIEYKKGRFKPKQGKKNFPVVEVSWFGANAFCKWMGGRLPTEAEWEYAASGKHKQSQNNTIKYKNIGELAWYKKNSGAYSHPVGLKKANFFGIHDMAGNVWEWCSDDYDKNYYTYSPGENPKASGPIELKVLRGGSWSNTAYSCRSHTRYKLEAKKTAKNIGFRVAAHVK